jgi:Ca2+/Na+ antiporter
MVFVPAWIPNLMLLVSCVICAIQHLQLKRANPVTNLQFVTIVFSILMMLFIAFHRRTDPWLSWGFLLIATGTLVLTLRQNRKLPPSRRIV